MTKRKADAARFWGCPENLARREMLATQEDFLRESPSGYEQSFSFGISYLPKGCGTVDFEALFRQTDAAMYARKKQRKENRE